MPVSALSHLSCIGSEEGAPHIPSVSFLEGPTPREHKERFSLASRRIADRITPTIWTALPHKPILLQIHCPRAELKDIV